MAADKLENLLNNRKNKELGDLLERAQSIGALTEALSSALDADFAGSIIAASVRDDGELVVVCPSPARAARLRYEEKVLLAAARETGRKVTRCTVRVGARG